MRKSRKLPKTPIAFPWSVCPDGVIIAINWETLSIGASMFIPAINMPLLIKQVKAIARARDIELIYTERIESGRLGVRFWRMR